MTDRMAIPAVIAMCHTSLQGFQVMSWQGPAREQLAVQRCAVQWGERGVAGAHRLCQQMYNCDNHSICTEAHKALQPVNSNRG